MFPFNKIIYFKRPTDTLPHVVFFSSGTHHSTYVEPLNTSLGEKNSPLDKSRILWNPGWSRYIFRKKEPVSYSHLRASQLMSMTRMLFYSNSFHKYPLTTKLTGVCFFSSTDFHYYCKLRSSASWSESVSSSESEVAAFTLQVSLEKGWIFPSNVLWGGTEELRNGTTHRKSKVEYSKMPFYDIFL